MEGICNNFLTDKMALIFGHKEEMVLSTYQYECRPNGFVIQLLDLIFDYHTDYSHGQKATLNTYTAFLNPLHA